MEKSDVFFELSQGEPFDPLLQFRNVEDAFLFNVDKCQLDMEAKCLGHPRILFSSRLMAVEHENRSPIELAKLIGDKPGRTSAFKT